MSRPLNLLNLSIILTAPPVGAPPRTIASFTLHCERLGLKDPGGVLIDPLTAGERRKLHWYLEEYWEQFQEKKSAQKGEEIEEKLLQKIGRCLYNQVFDNPNASKILHKWQDKPAKEYQLSIVSDIPKVLSLPWELLNDGNFLALLHGVSLVRCLKQSETNKKPTSFQLPLRVLVVTARPEGGEFGFIDPRIISREMLNALQGHIEAGNIDVEFLRPPTRQKLSERLSDWKSPIHILHFDGHGWFNRRKKRGELIFEKENYQPDPIPSETFIGTLRNTSVRLVVMTACQSAVGSVDNILSNVATGLIEKQIDAVVGMSASVQVPGAAYYVEAFYRALLGDPPGLNAQWHARQVLDTNRDRYILHRRGSQEGVFVKLHDWWVPHYYQRLPFELQMQEPIHIGQANNPPVSKGISGPLPDEPRYGFSGRSRELLQLERYLEQKKLVVVHGFSGVGKTALASEAADWLKRTKMYKEVSYISFELDGKKALEKLEELNLKAEEGTNMEDFLIVVDSMESILPLGGEYPLETSQRTLVCDILLKLAHKGTGVLLTTSDISVGDGKLKQGERVKHLLLKGLRDQDAYTLAMSLLNSVGEYKEKLRAELSDLLTYLDHHPLAIQLVLPMLDQRSPFEVKKDLATLLPKCIDSDSDTKARNHSLMNLLDRPQQRMSKIERLLLNRLALFEGGVSKESLLRITEIKEQEWEALQETLERVELLIPKNIHEKNVSLFFHFHPILAPYLRGQEVAVDNALCERYVQHYYELAKNLYHEDKRDQDHVQALVRLELPNLKYAMELLLTAGKSDKASEMADSICWFLEKFERRWELNKLRERIPKVEAAANIQSNEQLTPQIQ